MCSQYLTSFALAVFSANDASNTHVITLICDIQETPPLNDVYTQLQQHENMAHTLLKLLVVLFFFLFNFQDSPFSLMTVIYPKNTLIIGNFWK